MEWHIVVVATFILFINGFSKRDEYGLFLGLSIALVADIWTCPKRVMSLFIYGDLIEPLLDKVQSSY